jgi:hypothetical protein
MVPIFDSNINTLFSLTIFTVTDYKMLGTIDLTCRITTKGGVLNLQAIITKQLDPREAANSLTSPKLGS